MKRVLLPLSLILLLTACVPDGNTPPLPILTVSSLAEFPGIPSSPSPQPLTAEYDPSDFIATEILGRPTDSSATVNVVPAIPMELYYEYGTTPNEYSTRTIPQTAKANIPVETLLDGLQSNTRYYYRIRYQGAAGVQHSFITQRAPGSTFTFDIQGDSHPERVKNQFDPDLYIRTLLSAAEDQPDFYMTIGDDFSVDALKTVNPQTVTAQYVNQRQWLGLVGAPVFLVNGNHEQASLANLNGTPDNVAVWAQTARNAYFPQPELDSFYSGDAEPVEFIGLLRDYYAFTWGDALFVVIDPYWHSTQNVDNQFGADRDQKKNRDLWNVTLGDAQYHWFKQTLETSTSAYKFVFTHHILGTGRGGIEEANSFEWGDSAGLSEHRPGWDKTIQQLMAENHVTIFFQGHDHIFARQELDGVIYQTLPEPANPFYTYENQDSYQSGDLFPNSGHVRVTVSPDGITVDYIRSFLDKPDETIFSYTVK
jgi:phosphodiesterase/alkaline phosphatase D-like protein